jgi:hypothetical protein
VRWIPLLFLTTNAHATDLESRYLLRLRHLHQAEQIERLGESYNQVRTLRLACRLQIHAHTVPLACYETLQAEAEWQLRPKSAAHQLQVELDERCRKAARGLHLPAAEADLKAASSFCRAQVREGRAIERYRQGENSTPELVRTLN